MTAWGITESMRSERKNSFGISPHLFGVRRRGGRLDPLCANRFKCHWLDGPNAVGRVERLGSRYLRGLELGGFGPSLSFFSRRNPMAKGFLAYDQQINKLVNEKGLAVPDRG